MDAGQHFPSKNLPYMPFGPQHQQFLQRRQRGYG
jgi:hypothetical protein